MPSPDGVDNVVYLGDRRPTPAARAACPSWCDEHADEGSVPDFFIHNSKWIRVASDLFVQRTVASDVGLVFVLTDEPDSGREVQVSDAAVDDLIAVLKDPSWHLR